MALSRVIKIGNGTATQFVVDFALGYISPSDVTARVGTEVDGTGNPIYRTITFVTNSLLQISGPPAGNLVPVVFERTVINTDTLVHFSDGDVMDEINLDLSFKQILMVVHEVLDGRFGTFNNAINMGTFRINNLGDPVLAQDAATKSYVDGRLVTNESLLAQTIAARNEAAGHASSASSSASSAGTSATASEVSRQAAATQATNSGNSATASANSATAAQTARAGAETARTGAQTAQTASETARDLTLGYRNTAQTHATNAGNSATAASGSATASETSRQASGTSATSSANSATASEASRQAAGASATASGNSATAASAASAYALSRRDQAQRWAQEAEDVQVDDGDNPVGYSAYHWSKKAELAAGGGVISWAGLTNTISKAQAQAAIDLGNYVTTATYTTGLSGKANLSGAAFTGNVSVTGTLSANGRINVGTAGSFLDTDGNIKFTGVLATAYGDDLYAGLGSRLPLSGGAMTGGLGFGSALAASNVDVTRHLSLYGTTYGIGVTSSRFNLVSQGSWVFTSSNGTDRMVISNTGAVTINGTCTVTGLLAAPTAAAGTSNSQVATTSFVQAAISANVPPSLGAGQVWQDMLASRALNTTYQNTTGRAIYISTHIVTSTNGPRLYVSPNNTSWVTISDHQYSGRYTTSAVIPSGWYYRFTTVDGTFQSGIAWWAELR